MGKRVKKEEKSSKASKEKSYDKAKPETAKFTGKCEKLKGYIFDVGPGIKQDNFSDTLKNMCIHVGDTYKHGGDIRLAMENMQTIDITNDEPKPPANLDDKVEFLKYSKRLDRYIEQEEGIKRKVKSLFSLIEGQCSTAVWDKIKALEQYGNRKRVYDSIWLLESIQALSYQYHKNKYPEHALVDQIKKRVWQNDISVSLYHERFVNLMKITK